MRRGLRPVIALAAMALVFAASAVPASAAGPSDGLWYYDAMGVGGIHADGWNGEGVTIAVMDGPINPAVPTLQGANVRVRELSFCFDESGKAIPAISTAVDGPTKATHGTSVVSLISGTGAGYPGQDGVRGVAPGATVLYYAVSVFDNAEQTKADEQGQVVGGEPSMCNDAAGTDFDDQAMNQAMHEAMDAGADIISISASYPAGEYIDDAHIRALREGVVIVGSVANVDDIVLSMHWPAGGNGAVGVQAADANGTIATTEGRPNDDRNTVVIAPGIDILVNGKAGGAWEDQHLITGTSLATPIVAGFLALVKQKYPEATGNQLIQSLIHNTWVEDHELEFDPDRLSGYGYVSASHMLRVDPTQYPDENPLITADGIPSLDQITNWVRPTPEPTDVIPLGETSPSGSLNDALFANGVAAVFGFLVLLGVVALVIVLVLRKSRRGLPGVSKGEADG